MNFNQTDSYGNTAYGLLFWSGIMHGSFDKEFLRTVITSGKSIDCLCNYDNEIVLNLLSFGQMNVSEKNSLSYPPMESKYKTTNPRTSPLINAIVRNNYQLAKFIIELGVDINFPDEDQRTPLMHAVRQVKQFSSRNKFEEN